MGRRERYLWVMNDENLYRAWSNSKLGIKHFLTKYRESIDWYIEKMLQRSKEIK